MAHITIHTYASCLLLTSSEWLFTSHSTYRWIILFGDTVSLSIGQKNKGHWSPFVHHIRPWGTNKLQWPWPAFWDSPFTSALLETPFQLSLAPLVPAWAMLKECLSCAYACALCIQTSTHGLTSQLDPGPGLVIMNLSGHYRTWSWPAYWLSSLTLDLCYQHRFAWWSRLLPEPGHDL